LSFRCLIGLYGLNRSLRWTARSIVRNFIDPIRSAGADFTVAAHFNEPGSVPDDRTREFGIPITRRGVDLLNPDAMIFEKQEESRLPASILKAIDSLPPDPRLEPRQGMINLLYQLYSLNQMWNLVRVLPERHDLYIFLRPDMEYLDTLDVDLVISQIHEGADLITASWGQWGGLNDRFAFCSPRGADIYARRISLVKRFCEENGHLNAEELLKSVAEWNQLALDYTSLRAFRVRANGVSIRGEFEVSRMEWLRTVARKRLQDTVRYIARNRV